MPKIKMFALFFRQPVGINQDHRFMNENISQEKVCFIFIFNEIFF